MDVFARSSGDTTDIYTVENNLTAIAVLGAALGIVVALIVVVVAWLIGIEGSGAIVGCVAGGVAGAATAILGAPGRIQ